MSYRFCGYVLSKQSAERFDVYLMLYVQTLTPDDKRKDRPKHVECCSKINLRYCTSGWFYYRNIDELNVESKLDNNKYIYYTQKAHGKAEGEIQYVSIA
jgi:hypothetical protein